MSNQLDDFLISLGFDTTKVKSQLADLHKTLQSTADQIDQKREASGKKLAKSMSKAEVEAVKKAAKDKLAIYDKLDKTLAAKERGRLYTVPKVTAPKVKPSKDVQPKATAPKDVQPKVVAPKTATPKVKPSKDVQPKVVVPEVVAPKTATPKVKPSKDVQPKVVVPEVVAPKAVTPKVKPSKDVQPKVVVPEVVMPKVTAPKVKPSKDVQPKATAPKVKPPEAKPKPLTVVEAKEQARKAKAAKIEAATRRRTEIRLARNVVAEYERGITGPSNMSQRLEHMIKTSASMSQLKSFREDVTGKNFDTRNQMKTVGSLKSFDSTSASRAELDLTKARGGVDSLIRQMNKLGMGAEQAADKFKKAKTVDEFKALHYEFKKGISDWKIENSTSGRAKKDKPNFDYKNYRQEQLNFAVQSGAIKKEFVGAVKEVLSKTNTRGGIDQVIRTGGRVSHMKGADPKVFAQAGNMQQMQLYAGELRKATAETNRAARATVGLATVQYGLRDSTRNLIREYASMYALIAGTSAISRTGQQFEAISSAMLAATGNTRDQATEMKFLEDMSRRLGLSVLDTSEQYTKFLFAAKGKISTEQTHELFTGMSELGTVLGLTKERMKLSFMAITQMMNKTTVSSEDLKQQLAESFPGAIQLFAKAMGVSELAMFDLMKSGKVLSSEVLPKFAAETAKAANEGGALALKLDSARVAQGQFFAELELAGKKVFNSDFDKGSKTFFQTTTNLLKENGKTLEEIGGVYNKIFTMMAKLLTLLAPVIEKVVRSLDSMLTIIQRLSSVDGIAVIGVIALMTSHFYKATKGAKTLGAAMSAAFLGPKLILLTIIGLMDEVRAFFDSNLIGLFDDPNASQKERDTEAAQRRKMFGMSKKGDDKILQSSGISTEPSFAEDMQRVRVERGDNKTAWWNFPMQGFNIASAASEAFRQRTVSSVQSMVFNIHGVADVAQLKREITSAVAKSQESSMLMSAAGRD